MRPPFYQRKTFWEGSEFWVSIPAALTAFAAAIVPVKDKSLPSAAACVLVILGAVCRHMAKRLAHADWTRQQDEVEALRQRYGAQAKRMIGKILETFRSRYFEGEAGEERYEHRVTLFACSESADGDTTGKRLVIFARAGIHPDSTSSWPVDDNDPRGCRGFAASIWFHEVTKFKLAACDWPENDGDPLQKARYAESLEITVAEAEALRVHSRMFVGTPILVNNQRWGVLLLDSQKDGPPFDRTKSAFLRRYAKVIEAALEGIEP